MTGALCMVTGIAGADVLRLDSATYTRVTINSAVTVQFQVNLDGGIYATTGGAFLKKYDWILPNSRASAYECRWTASGTAPDVTPAAVNTWVDCSTNRTWSTTSAIGAEEIRSFVCEIGLLGTSTALKSQTITLDANGLP